MDKLSFLILTGTAGLSKSERLRRVAGRRSFWVEGNATAFGMYQGLFENRDRPVVIDDVDSLYTDAAAVRLLKWLCRKDPIERLAWYPAVACLGIYVPGDLETESRVCVIANQWIANEWNGKSQTPTRRPCRTGGTWCFLALARGDSPQNRRVVLGPGGV